MIKAIKTKYNSINFRSRLEAKWAAFFDFLEWEYEYEPFDLSGYIPDFILKFHKPVLVEIKPEMTLEGLHKYYSKISESGWKGTTLILGATLHKHPWGGVKGGQSDGVTIGLLFDTVDPSGHNESGIEEDDAILERSWCRCSNRLKGHYYGWECRGCGLYDKGNRHDGYEGFYRQLWKHAGNTVQWNK